MKQLARGRLDLVQLFQGAATWLTWLVTLAVAACLWACSNELAQPAAAEEEPAADALSALEDDASFSCTTSLREHRDPCLEGGCCGFERASADDALGEDSAQCGYGTLEEEGAERATGAVCACSFSGRSRVSCITDYESGDVECTCTEL